ncbi:hypothetical protein IMZ48_44180, partial [Candidatus Bathyarchaeota archaeon]|nr:hypothetical protein [Candidatus Bathyarchaeota archaeon]
MHVCNEHDANYDSSLGAPTQVGFGYDDGTYTHSSQDKGVVLEIDTRWDRNQFRFARLFSRDYDDLVEWFQFNEVENKHERG